MPSREVAIMPEDTFPTPPQSSDAMGTSSDDMSQRNQATDQNHANSPEDSESTPDQLLLEDLRIVFGRREATTSAEGAPADDLQGQSVGRFAVGRLIGEGGMARVYEAIDTSTDRKVALKMLKPQYRSNQALCARFEREARSMARLQHENIVRILDFPAYGPIRAIVMELLPGGSLRKRLNSARAARRHLDIDHAVAAIIQAAIGCNAAHGLHIVHRDIKPSNLLLGADGTIKVADFGAIMVAEGTTWLTGVGQQIGTPGYMSPEQCKGERVTPASDVYSLGATLFELLTGHLPFEVEEASPFAIMLKHISEPPSSPTRWRAAIPDPLAAVVLKCLNKNPKDRYASGGEFSDALRRLATTPTQPAEQQPDKLQGMRVDVTAVRKQLQLLPQRAIVCWACRCARYVQHLNPDPRVEKALLMAESTLTDADEAESPHSVTRALSRIRALRTASLKAAYTDDNTMVAKAAIEAARAAAAAAASAGGLCINDTAADAAFAARSAIAALQLANKPIKPFWDAARSDYQRLIDANLGKEGTIGQAIPPSLFGD